MSNLRSRLVWARMLLLGTLAACGGEKVHTVGTTAGGGSGSGGQATAGGATALPNLTCGNDRKDGEETDIDCGGGECDGCPTSARCERHADCASRVCRAGLCQQGTCDDATTNGSESDVDCGQDCTRCEEGKACNTSADCQSEVCTGGLCRPPTCHDGDQNGQESAVDCGGGCAPCPDGDVCHDDRDCASSLCVGARCVSCHDGVKNGGESDTDCGGPDCGVCAVGQICVAEEDCANGLCRSDPGGETQNVCMPDHCLNLKVDADEIDVDCGGSCDNCGSGRTCIETRDCEVGTCVDGTCVELCGEPQGQCLDGGRCEGGECVYCDSAADCNDDRCGAVGGVCACLKGYFVCNAP
jgi:hypothetical protein